MTRVVADRHRCEGYAVCVVLAPDTFDLGDDDKVVVLGDGGDGPTPEAIEAVDSCPVHALKLSES